MGVFTLNCHDANRMFFSKCLVLYSALNLWPFHTPVYSVIPVDTVEYQVNVRYSGFQAGWLTLLKTGNEYWFPLRAWLDQSGFAYQVPSKSHSGPGIYRLKRAILSSDSLILSGYSPVLSRIWKISSRTWSTGNPDKAGQDKFQQMMDHDQTIWVNHHWIARQYGMNLDFREQALELDFAGAHTAPVREWHDYHVRWKKKIQTPKVPQNRSIPIQGIPIISNQPFEISTWSGRYRISLDRDRVNSSLQWDAVGHAGKLGLRLLGSVLATLESSEQEQCDSFRTCFHKNPIQMEWPGLELEWAPRLNHQINLSLLPSSPSSPLRISGSNILMSRIIGFELQSGLHSRQWNPPPSINEWSLNHGTPMAFQLPLDGDSSYKSQQSAIGVHKSSIPVHLLPGTNRIDYRIRNAWGGLSDRHLMWTIPGSMIPKGHWAYRYEINAPLRFGGMLSYGLMPTLGLQTQAAWEPTKDSLKSPSWNAQCAAIWTAGRFLHGQSEIVLSNIQTQWRQDLFFNFGLAFQGALRYQKTIRRWLNPWNPWQNHLTANFSAYPDPNTIHPWSENLDLNAQWLLPRGFGLKMIRVDFPIIHVARTHQRREQYRITLQLEARGQQCQWLLPQKRLLWQGRIQAKGKLQALVYHAMIDYDGWQAFAQCHGRGGHHVGLSYTLAKQSPTSMGLSTTPRLGIWALEWKWTGLQSSRTARLQTGTESRKVEFQGQFLVSSRKNSLPIKAAHGIALLHLYFYGDSNGNGIKDTDEGLLDATGGLELPAGIPSQTLWNGSVLLGPLPNHSRVRVRLTPHNMPDPGWITESTELELSSRPNSTTEYEIGFLRGRQIQGQIEWSTSSPHLHGTLLAQSAGGLRVHALRLSNQDSIPADYLGCSRPIGMKVSDSLTQSDYQTLTLSDGYFEINDLMPGLYRVWPDSTSLNRYGYSGKIEPQTLDLREREFAEIKFYL